MPIATSARLTSGTLWQPSAPRPQNDLTRPFVEGVLRRHIADGDLPALLGRLGTGRGLLVDEREEAGELPRQSRVPHQAQASALGELYVPHAGLGDLQNPVQGGTQHLARSW
ncbi:hypothetical protein [Streptomyces sp. NPDC057094]|uniref:hypothetical protein n=1 Tax=Streptomyces sp. NPDC057094 TaxID=3346018 RepID=UPI003644F543